MLALATAAALVFAATAAAWYQYYVWYGTFNPGGIALSDYNSNLNYQEVHWDSINGSQTMGETYCNGSCYGYTYGNTGLIQDSVTSISYGRGKCHSWDQNTQSFTVYWCYVQN